MATGGERGMREYRPPGHARVLRPVLRPLFRGIFRALFRVAIYGREHIPQPPYLVIANHVSIADPPLLLAFWPVALEAIGARDLWYRPGQNWLVRLYGTIPVYRNGYDRTVLERMVAVLRSGRPLLMAPEGRRSHVPGMQEAHPGAAFVVDQAQVPVLPVGVVGTTDAAIRQAFRGARPPLEVRIGEPFTLPPLPPRGAARRAARLAHTRQMMERIAALLPPAYRGVYG